MGSRHEDEKPDRLAWLRDVPKQAVALAQAAAEAHHQRTRARHIPMVAVAAAGQRTEAMLAGHALLEHDPSHPVTSALLDRAPRPAPAWAEAELRWLRGADKQGEEKRTRVDEATP